jgi:hypothetical protein
MKVFKHACFISYCHGQGELVKGFIEQLKTALKDYLEPYFELDECVYIDEDRLAPGYKYNAALAKAICRSVVMIVVYMPKYWKHDYCCMEYTTMEQLEEKRMQLVGTSAAAERGMIIPILFRGKLDDVPERIRKNIHFCDFSKFTTATSDIRKNEEFVKKIEQIATYVHELATTYDDPVKNPCSMCDAFTFTSAPAPETTQPAVIPFPFR